MSFGPYRVGETVDVDGRHISVGRAVYGPPRSHKQSDVRLGDTTVGSYTGYYICHFRIAIRNTSDERIGLPRPEKVVYNEFDREAERNNNYSWVGGVWTSFLHLLDERDWLYPDQVISGILTCTTTRLPTTFGTLSVPLVVSDEAPPVEIEWDLDTSADDSAVPLQEFYRGEENVAPQHTVSVDDLTEASDPNQKSKYCDNCSEDLRGYSSPSYCPACGTEL